MFMKILVYNLNELHFQVTKTVPIQQQVEKLEPVPKYETIKYEDQDYQKYETATEYIPEKYTSKAQEYTPTIQYKYPTAPETIKFRPIEKYAPTEKYHHQVIQEPSEDISEQNTLAQILKKLQETNTLPQTFTPQNIDNSIRTLVKILSSLKKQNKFQRPIVVAEDGANSGEYVDEENEAGVGLGEVPGSITNFPGDTPEGGTPGKPGVDYPALSSIPQTSFNCKTQRYKGFFGDPDTNCQVN